MTPRYGRYTRSYVKKTTLKMTSFRFSPEFLRQIDSYVAKKTRETGIKWTRVAAVKFLVRSALEQEDVRARGKKL